MDFSSRILLVAVGFLIFGHAQGQSQLMHLKWLQGTWSSDKTVGKGVVESWRLTSDTVLVGSSVTLRNGVVVGKETMRLCEERGKVTYYAKPEGQNNGQAIPFLLNPQGLRCFRFENARHDFPKAIVYNRIGPDSIRVELFGAGDKPAMVFKMGRR